MEKTMAHNRAEMPEGTSKMLNKRSLERDNRNLLPLLKPDMNVLDVGCGTGIITKGIANYVLPNGRVTGIDISLHLISEAIKTNHQTNMEFLVEDIFSYDTTVEFDLITTSRVLQWMNNPEEALVKMKSLLKPGGIIAILDYNHEKIKWQPEPPASTLQFYEAFLTWRKDAGFENQVADKLPNMLSTAGYNNIQTENCSELYHKSEDDFISRIKIWSEVAESRGKQMVKDGYLSEEERINVIEEYNEWAVNKAIFMQLYLSGAHGRN
jgi:ubiquinone/menaquinone biosynthesis C-methylase UbiE